jgi:hypothetical protein
MLCIIAAGIVACGGPTSVDQARLRQLSKDPILDQPPEGFVPDGEPLEIAGTSDLQGNRSGSEITQNYKTTEDVITGTNAWAEQLSAQGWTVRTMSCHDTYGRASAERTFDDFTGRAYVTVDIQLRSSQLRLVAPEDGQEAFVTAPGTADTPEPCS